MTLFLKQSTSIDIRVGPFVDATDAVTPETGVTLGGADQAEVLKANGAATAAMAGTFAAVTGSDGWYDYTVATGDVDTVGEVVFVVQDSSVCLPVLVRGYVVEEAVYDSMYAASATGPNVGKTGYALSAAGVDAVWDETMAGHSTADTAGLLMNEWQDGGRLDLILDIIAADVVNIDGIVPANAAAVNAQVLDVLNTDTFSEPGAGAPTATPTAIEILRYLYFTLRNKKTATATTIVVRNDADSADIYTKTISDDGTTYTEGEAGA